MQEITLKTSDGSIIKGTAYETRSDSDYFYLAVRPQSFVRSSIHHSIALKWNGKWNIGRMNGSHHPHQEFVVQVPNSIEPGPRSSADSKRVVESGESEVQTVHHHARLQMKIDRGELLESC